MATTPMSRRASFCARRSAPRFVRTKTSESPRLGLEQLDEPVDLVVRGDRHEAVLDDAVLDVGLVAVSRSATASRCTRCASSPTSPSSVAEKSIVCRTFGRRRTIRSTCGRKPMSSIRSASSRTSVRTASRTMSFRSTRSWRRPGVATTMCAPLRRFACDAHRRAAVGDADADALRRGERRELVGDLERELAGRHEHERGRRLPVGRRALDERQAEGERLARSGRRLRQHVEAGERVREDERLDTERLDDAAGRERLLDGRAHAER